MWGPPGTHGGKGGGEDGVGDFPTGALPWTHRGRLEQQAGIEFGAKPRNLAALLFSPCFPFLMQEDPQTGNGPDQTYNDFRTC